MLNKVPQITIVFWIIKVLATTVGETAADFLNMKLGLGLTITSLIMSTILAVVIVFQMRAKKYIPAIYWLSVVLLSIVGTLISDNLVDNLGVSLVTTSTIFGIALIVVFVAWYISEHSLSVHTIVTTKREAFYWAAILFTFALGTSAGDLISEAAKLGYVLATVLFGGLIAAIYVAFKVFKINAILAFWMAYILTRPLGASLGDLLTQPTKAGGLGLGAMVTSAIFLSAILAAVIYLTIKARSDVETPALAVAE
jgi:uncharacterized membrane-anchored protein